MSNARNLADVISGNYDVPAGSLDNVDLTSRVAKTGDTMTGNLIVNANVGIGTSSPTRLLQLNSSTTEVAMKLTNSTSGSGSSDGTDIKYEGLNLSINNREAGSIIFETNNISRATIDSAGRVTMPYQPSFNGTNSATFGMANSTWSAIPVNTIRWDRGNNFNASTFRFTAPVGGVYQVNTSVQLENCSSVTWVYLYPVVNGTNSATNGVNFSDFTPTGTYYTHSHSCTLLLSAGDYMEWKYIKSGGSADLKGATENSFSIHLLA